MKHTKGPWRVEGTKKLFIEPIMMEVQTTDDGWEYADGSTSMAINKGWNAYTPTKGGIAEAQANARLIASAPELLEACQYVVKWHKENDSGEGELFGLDFVTTCISAITKATQL